MNNLTNNNSLKNKWQTNDLRELGVDDDQLAARESAKRILKGIGVGFDKTSANPLLYGLKGEPVGDLFDLRHGEGSNFNVCGLCPELVEGKTHLWVLDNSDTQSGDSQIKFPGGGSWPGESVIETITAEFSEELGKFPRRISLLKTPKVIPSKEFKVQFDYERNWNHYKIPLIVHSTMGSPLKYRSKDRENSVPRLVYYRDLMTNPNMNWTHKEYLRDFVNNIKFNAELGQKFRDVVFKW